MAVPTRWLVEPKNDEQKIGKGKVLLVKVIDPSVSNRTQIGVWTQDEQNNPTRPVVVVGDKHEVDTDRYTHLGSDVTDDGDAWHVFGLKSNAE